MLGGKGVHIIGPRLLDPRCHNVFSVGWGVDPTKARVGCSKRMPSATPPPHFRIRTQSDSRCFRWLQVGVLKILERTRLPQPPTRLPQGLPIQGRGPAEALPVAAAPSPDFPNKPQVQATPAQGQARQTPPPLPYLCPAGCPAQPRGPVFGAHHAAPGFTPPARGPRGCPRPRRYPGSRTGRVRLRLRRSCRIPAGWSSPRRLRLWRRLGLGSHNFSPVSGLLGSGPSGLPAPPRLGPAPSRPRPQVLRPPRPRPAGGGVRKCAHPRESIPLGRQKLRERRREGERGGFHRTFRNSLLCR